MTFFEALGSLVISEQSRFTDKLEGIYHASTQFSEKIANLYRDLNDWWEERGRHVSKSILGFAITLNDADKRQELIDCYVGWGKFGWTINSKATSAMFDMLPSTQAEADSIMLQYCSIDNVATMKKAIAERGVNQQDLDEAFLCYTHGMYKASALIIFALIDHNLVNMGYRKRPRKNEEQGWRKVGDKAVLAYRDQYQQKCENALLFINLWFLNITTTLLILLADGGDFQNEPDMINRNFVSHGMSQRNVTEVDCFKVWSALYSLTTLLPTLEESLE